MAETIIDKVTCEKCGADVREGTTFCYNCGAPLNETPLSDSGLDSREIVVKPLVDETPEPDKGEESNANKLARAADERKKARVGLRKDKEYVWEPAENLLLTVLATLMIALISLVVVSLMVFWK